VNRPLLLLLFLFSCFSAFAGDENGSAAAPVNPAYRRPDRSLYESGRYVYEQHCVVCHGERGDGMGEMANEVGVIRPRRFSSGLFKYRSTPWGKLPTDDDLIRTIRQGRTGTAMGAFTNLSEEEVRAVTEYVKFFSRKWRRPENHSAPIVLPPEPAWLMDPAETARRAEAGRTVFQANCAACHGPEGDGRGPAAAALKDDAGDPAFPADLRQPHLRCGDEPGDIFRTLATGLNGTPMVSFADALTAEQKWEITAYILTLRRAHAEAARR
jgi:mono/diheme cytochrome c family protein